MEKVSSFATRLRELRGAESQVSFASAIDIHRIQYAKYESGKNAPSIDVLERICRVHACSADWLLGLKDRNDSSKKIVSVKAGNGGIAIGGVGNRVSGTIVAGGDAGHAVICKSCPYRKKVQAMEKLLTK